MSHSDLTSFLINEFGAEGPLTYASLPASKKSRLQSHLHSILRSGFEKNLQDIKKNFFFKLHFNVTRNTRTGCLTIPNSTFLKKMGFLGDISIITFPFHDMNFSNDNDLQSLLKVVSYLKEFNGSNFYVLPSYDTQQQFWIASDKFRNEFGVTSANFTTEELLFEFYESKEERYLFEPRFSTVSPGVIIRVREEMPPKYNDFQRYIKLKFIGQSDREVALLKELIEADQEFRKLTKKFQNIQKTCKSTSISSLVACSAAFLGVLCPGSAIIASAATSGVAITKAFIDEWKAMQERRAFVEQDLFLFWRLKNPYEELDVNWAKRFKHLKMW